ncbi:MAG: plasmid mobilization relaxosome protein MobC [Cellvibrionaceae bacterium]
MPGKAVKRPRISVDLKNLNDDFQQYCLGKEESPSEVIREMVRRLLTDGEDFSFTAKDFIPGYEEGNRTRFEVRLTDSETKCLREVNGVLRYDSIPRLIIAMLRVALTKMPHFGELEYRELTESNRQLLAIGRNLNQIAKALNGGGNTDKLVVDGIRLLKKRIDNHTQHVSKLLAVSVERWGFDNHV